MYYVSTLCDEAIWLRGGEVAGGGDAQRVVLEYERTSPEGGSAMSPHAAPRWGRTGASGTSGVVGADGAPRSEFRPGEPWGVELDFSPDEATRPLQIHFAVSTRDHVVCFSADSRPTASVPSSEKTATGSGSGLDALPLGKGEFGFTPTRGRERPRRLRLPERPDVSRRVGDLAGRT